MYFFVNFSINPFNMGFKGKQRGKLLVTGLKFPSPHPFTDLQLKFERGT